MKNQNPKENLEYFVRNISTIECTVRFRMSADDEQVVRRFYNMDPNLPMFCPTVRLNDRIQYEGIEHAEVLATGNGWYTIHGDGVKINSALHTFRKIAYALQVRDRPRVDDANVVKSGEHIRDVYAEKRRVQVIVKQRVDPRTGRSVSVAVTRALQVTPETRAQGVSEVMLKLADVLKQPEPKPFQLDKGVELLKRKFHRS